MLNKEQTDFLLVNAYNAAVRAGARIIDIYTGDADYGVDLKSVLREGNKQLEFPQLRSP